MMLLFGNALRSRLVGIGCVLLLLTAGGTKGFASEEEAAATVHLSSPRGVFVDNEGRVFVASSGNSRIVVINYNPVRVFGEDDWASSLVPEGIIKGVRSPPLQAPCDVAVDSQGRIVVADTGNDLVKIYPKDPRSRPRIIGRRLVGSLFSRPQGIAVDERDNIIVFDTGNGEVKVLSPEGKVCAVVASGTTGQGEKFRLRLQSPIAGCSLGKGYLAIADRSLASYSLWRYDPISPGSKPCEFIGYGPSAEDSFNFTIRDIAYNEKSGLLAYLGSNYPLRDSAFLYFQGVDPDNPSKLVGAGAFPWLRVPLVGWLTDPEGLAFTPEGNLYITDAATDSLQRISGESFAFLGTPVSIDARHTRAALKYFTTAEAPTFLEYGAMGDPTLETAPAEFPRNYGDATRAFAHAVYLSDLLPSTRYAYRYRLSRDFFHRFSREAVPNFSRTMCFAMPPETGTTPYLDIPLRVLIFTNVLEPGARSSPGIPSPEASPDVAVAVSEREIEKSLLSQLNAARVFFWVNSRMTCNIRLDTKVISDRLQSPLLPSLKKGKGATAGLDDFLVRLNDLVRKHSGRELSASPSLFLIQASGPHDPQLRHYVTNGAPGMTCGLPYVGKAVSIFVCGSDATSSFITEYWKHLLIMHLSSGREISLAALLKETDAAGPMVTLDSLADLLRAIGRETWLSNRYGIFKLAADADGDAIPDDEPDCPLDEKRFGTSSRAADTDGDGVADLEEILASRWASSFPLTYVRDDGTPDGVRTLAKHPAPSPAASDTDGDGVRDAEDKNPLCPLDDLIQKLPVALDGTIRLGEWEGASAMRIVDSDYSGVLRAAWSETHLCFSLTGEEAEQPPRIRIRIDGTADGFLRGSDNLAVVFEPKSDGSFDVRADTAIPLFLGSGSAAATPPVRPLQIVAAWSRSGREVHVEVGFPKSPALGLNLFPGEEIGFDLELRPTKSALWLRVFEPLTLFRGELVQPGKEVKMPD